MQKAVLLKHHQSSTSYKENTMNKDILFFTCATGVYQHFVIPYIFFASRYNKSASFEILVDDADLFIETNKRSLRFFYKNDIVVNIRTLPVVPVKPKMQNSYRFIIEPELQAEYVYIGDIDIMIVEEILPLHLHIFEENLPYSNIVRKGTKKLTGLHFAKYNKQYPLPEISGLVKSIENDEELLYEIMSRKGMIYPSEVYDKIERPQHGIHMSLNRLPYFYQKSRSDWGMHRKYLEKLQTLFEEDYFKDFFATLDVSSRMTLINVLVLTRGALTFDKSSYQAIMIRDRECLNSDFQIKL